MEVSPAHRFMCFLVLVILPHVNLGLLSDYKICGDSACESMLSRAQAIKDYYGKDCHFLSFRRGENIIVYHKLTGKREDLWAGSIDRQFGYFPKDAVQEEQVYAAVEKVVETQESDFFCMDEFGNVIDSSHLDSGNDFNDDGESAQKNIQESETTKTSTDNLDFNAPTSADLMTESTMSAQEVEQDENKSDGDAAEDPNENPAALKEQGGSPSAPWLSSSMTGWFSHAKEEQPDHLDDGQGQDEKKEEIQSENSLASSVTGWLGLGGEVNSDNAEESVNSREENADSVTSTVSGWLGFGSEKQAASENEEKEEPVEKFRSRRFSLDLEGSQLHEEENKDTGTLGWLRNGLSNTLGFDLTNQESGQEISEEKEEPASGSWFEMGGILGFNKEKNEGKTEHAGSGFEETESEQERKGANIVDASMLQSASTDDVKTELEEPSKDQNDYLAVQIGEKEPKGEDLSADNKNDNETDETISAETEDEDHSLSKYIENEHEDEITEPHQEKFKIPTGGDHDISGPSDISVSLDNPFVDLKSNMDAFGATAQEDDVKVPLSVESVVDVDDYEELLSSEDLKPAADGQTSSEQSQLVFQPDEKKEQLLEVNANFTSQDTEEVLVIDNHVEKETSKTELTQEEGTLSVEHISEEFKISPFTVGDSESLKENASKKDDAEVSSEGDMQNTESAADSEAVSEGGVDGNDGTRQDFFGVEENKLEYLKEVEEIQEEEKQEKVEHLEDEEKDKQLEEFEKVEEIKEESYKEVDALEDQEQQLEKNEVKEEGVQLEITHEQDKKVMEEEEKIVEESKDKNKQDQVEEPYGEKKNEDVVELMKEMTGEMMEQIKEEEQEEEEEEEETKKLEGLNDLIKEEDEGKLLHVEEQSDKIWDANNRPAELERNSEEIQENSMGLSPSPETGNLLSEEEKWNHKEEMQESLAEVQYDNMDQAEEKHEEDDNYGCSNELCAAVSGEALLVEGDEGSTEVGESLAGEEMTGEQNDHTDGTRERKSIQRDDTAEEEVEGEAEDSDNTKGNDDWGKEGGGISASAGDPEETVSLGSKLSSDDQREETVESETAGKFGLFRNAFGLFSQAATSDTEESTQPAQISDLSLDDVSQQQDASAPGMDSTTDSSQNQYEPPESSTEQPQSYYPPTDTGFNTPSPNPQAPLQTKALSKHYTILLSYVNTEEITILLDLFGENKLQFLEYILSSSEAENLNYDQSIVSDIEMLLHHHTERLVAPSIRLGAADALSEDEGKTGTLIALQKLEILLKTVKKSFIAGQSDVSIHPDETSCVGTYCLTSVKDDEIYTEEQSMEKEDPSGAVKNNIYEEEPLVTESDNTGVLRQIMDFIHQMAEESITHSRGVRDLIAQLILQVQITNRI